MVVGQAVPLPLPLQAIGITIPTTKLAKGFSDWLGFNTTTKNLVQRSGARRDSNHFVAPKSHLGTSHKAMVLEQMLRE
jgi:hypothetical protein